MNQNKLIFLTGAGRGIGRAIALKLAQEGFSVAGCARSLDQLEETKRLSGGKIEIRSVDVTSESALQDWFANAIAKTKATPWGLITAAGIYGPIGSLWENDWNKWKESMEVNLYGTLLPVRIFTKELLQRKSPGRIILLSGGGATQPLPNFTSYCASKAAVVRVGETLALELKPFGFTVNSLAPGAVNTKLTDEIIEAGPGKAGAIMYQKALEQKESGGAQPEKAADLCNYLLSEQGECVTGKLLSAIWDPWSTFHKNSAVLKHPDLYTLRRITEDHIGVKKT